MAINKGWYKLDRSITKGPVWLTSEPFGIRDAYIDLLLMANYEEVTFIPRHSRDPIVIHPGEVVTSYDHLAVRWKWGKKRTVNYINLLEKAKLIRKKSYNWGTVLTLVEYDKSGNEGNASDTASDTIKGTPATPLPTLEKAHDGRKIKKDIKEGHNNKRNQQGTEVPADDSGWDWGKPE